MSWIGRQLVMTWAVGFKFLLSAVFFVAFRTTRVDANRQNIQTGKYVVIFPCTVHPGLPTPVTVTSSFPFGVMVNAVLDVKRPDSVTVTQLASVSSRLAAMERRDITLPAAAEVGEGTLQLIVWGTNADNGVEVFRNRSDVAIGPAFSIFVQTDKGVYKPGQTVRMRVLAVKPDLLPYSAGRLMVQIKDKDNNRMALWESVTLRQGVWEEDFPLSELPVLGRWTIVVKGKGSDAQDTFEVAEYVLPKVKVSVTSPSYIAKNEESAITMHIAANYTYGKPVNGSAQVAFSLHNVYQYCGRNQPAARPMIIHYASLSAAGTAAVSLQRRDFFQLFCSPDQFRSYFRGWQKLFVNVTITDGLTNEQQNATSSIGLYGNNLLLQFDKSVTLSFMKPGMDYYARLLVSMPDNKPAGDGTLVEIQSTTWFVAGKKSTHKRANATHTSRGGVVSFKMAVPPGASSLSLHAHIQSQPYTNAYHTCTAVESPSKTFLHLSAGKAKYAAGEMATFTVKATSALKNVSYNLHSRGYQVASGYVSMNSSSGKIATFSVPVQSSFAPNVKVVVYAVHSSGEILADSLSVAVKMSFANVASVSFDSVEARPHDNVTLSVKAASGSFVGISVIDQSTLLLRQSNDITEEVISENLEKYNAARRPATFDEPVWAEDLEFAPRHLERSAFPWYYDGKTAGEVFSNAGICVLTDFNLLHEKHFSFLLENGVAMEMVSARASDAQTMKRKQSPTSSNGGKSLAVTDRTRKYFPETWLWDSKVVGQNGLAMFKSVVPDTITSWVASAFAISSSQGLTVASQQTLRAFQPFFISLKLPYSIIRGEELTLQVNIFNYLDTMQNTVVNLTTTAELQVREVQPGRAVSKQVSIARGQAASVVFHVVAEHVGLVQIGVTAQCLQAADSVQKRLLVEPEGVTVSFSKAIFIDLNTSRSQSELLQLQVPNDTVNGSARAVVSVVGDIMGPALSNLDKLLKMPFGCGEQNMLNFAPDIFIVKYLTATGQATNGIVGKAKRFMMTGYQRELTYQRHDHSFSAFGNNDREGSLWLTAFVVKSFSQARPFIYIDPEVIERSLNYIIAQQRANGVFPQIGFLHHQSMKGGIKGDIARTAYVLAALVETQRHVRDLQTSAISQAIEKAKHHLEKQLDTITDNYTLAIAAYALQLASSLKAGIPLAILKRTADRTGGTMKWTGRQAKSRPARHWAPPWEQSSSADVELNAYALLALLSSGDQANSALVAKWLSQQQNSFGGFCSTQDTVVGLQALAEFAEQVRASPPKMTVTLTSQSAQKKFVQLFSISFSNSLVLQQTRDVLVPSDLHVSATGSGTALLSVEVLYNVPVNGVAAYDMSSRCSLWQQHGSLGASCRYCTHLSSIGQTLSMEGMSLLEVGLPSGFSVSAESVQRAMVQVPSAKRFEIPDRRVIFYLDSITNQETCFEFDMLQEIAISHLQPASLKTINYYQPSVMSAQLYSISKNFLGMCCHCPTCEGCTKSAVAACKIGPKPGAQKSHSPAKTPEAAFILLISALLVSFVT